MLLLAIGFFSVAVYLPRAIDNAVNTGIDDFITVDAQAQADNSKYFRTYTNPDDPDSTTILYKVYLWHCTNPTAVIGTGAAPDFQEKGPYVYRKKVYKRNVVFGKDVYNRDIVSYQTQTQFIYDQSLSGTLTESDMITNLNIPFVGLKTNSLLGTLYAQYPSDGSRYFATHNVSEWLWGYVDPVISRIHSFYPLYTPTQFNGILGPNENVLNPQQPQDVLFVGTKPDQSLIRSYVKYNGMDSLTTTSFTPPSTITVSPTWKSGLANRVFGSDGTQFPRNLDEGATINAYVSQLTRTVVLGNLNSEKVTFKSIDMLHFTLPDIYLGNAAAYPFNGDFYMLGYTGMANLTATGKTDFYVSKPHFMDADVALVNSMTGVTTGTKAQHDTYLNVEPISGATMQAAKRLQLSIRITPVNVMVPLNATYYIPQTWGANLPNQATGQYMPVYWAEEYGEVSDSSASSFTSGVYGGRRASMAINIAGEVLGCAFVVGGIIMMWVAAMKDNAGNTGTKL